MVRPAGPFDFDRIGDDIVARAASDFAKSQEDPAMQSVPVPVHGKNLLRPHRKN